VKNASSTGPQPYPDPTEDTPTKVEGSFVHLGLDIIGSACEN